MSRVDAMHKYAQHEMAKAFADSPLLLGCLRLNDVITNEGTNLMESVGPTNQRCLRKCQVLDSFESRVFSTHPELRFSTSLDLFAFKFGW